MNNITFRGIKAYTNGSGGKPFRLYYYMNNFTISDSVLNSSYPGGSEFYVPNTITGGTWNFTNVTLENGSAIRVNWSAGGNGTLNYGKKIFRICRYI